MNDLTTRQRKELIFAKADVLHGMIAALSRGEIPIEEVTIQVQCITRDELSLVNIIDDMIVEKPKKTKIEIASFLNRTENKKRAI